jgi:hypothetical protein
MKRTIGTGMLGGLAFAVLSLTAERNADACQELPPPEEDECATMQSGDTTYYAQRITTRETDERDCGCGQTVAGLPVGAVVSAAGFFNTSGEAATDFCGAGVNADTTAAFQRAFPGVGWSAAALSALSAGGITGGEPGYAVFRIDGNPTGAPPDTIALAQINFETDGDVEVDNEHQVVAAIDAEQCTDCSQNWNTQACIALANAAWQLNMSTFTVDRVACAKSEATVLLGLGPQSEADAPSAGCDVSGSRGPAAALLLVMVGAALTIARSRRG